MKKTGITHKEIPRIFVEILMFCSSFANSVIRFCFSSSTFMMHNVSYSTYHSLERPGLNTERHPCNKKVSTNWYGIETTYSVMKEKLTNTINKYILNHPFCSSINYFSVELSFSSLAFFSVSFFFSFSFFSLVSFPFVSSFS